MLRIEQVLRGFRFALAHQEAAPEDLRRHAAARNPLLHLRRGCKFEARCAC
ncbi:MAG TPA: hypothetical protein VE029_12540 [Rhizobacter sp.]|nr:hypothetical protein [Rhizobacter sp.]